MALAEFKWFLQMPSNAHNAHKCLRKDQEEDINYINYKSGDKLFRQNIKNAEE